MPVPGLWGTPIARRQVMRVGAAAAGVTAVGGLLSACTGGKASGTAAQPSVATPVIELTFMPWWIYWNPTGRSIVQQQADTFAQTHPGLRLTALPGPQGGGASTSGVISSIIAGTGPDVVGDCCGSWVTYTSQGVFADLNTYFKKDNVDVGTWAKAQAAALSSPAGQLGLPIYNGPVVYACRQDILDNLGLQYPDPQWSYKDAAALWTQCAGTYQVSGKPHTRVGANFWWQSHSWYAQAFLFYGFGGAEMDATGTKARFDDPGSIEAAQWVYPLLWNKVLGAGTGTIADGSAAFEPAGGWSIPRNVTGWGNKFKWQYYPLPKFPKGRTTFNNNDFWGMNAQSKHLEGAWQVMKWLTFEDDWQRFCMKTTLLAPCKVALWAEFEQQLIATAPILANKGLNWFRDAAEGGYGYPEEFFKYQATQADTLIGKVMGDIYDRKIDVPGGFAKVTQQVNALEVAGAADTVAATVAQALFPTTGAPIAAVQPGL